MTTRAEKYKKEILEKLKKQYESRSFKDAPFSTEINMIFSQVDELQSTITNKDAEIIRLRELLKSTYDELNYYVSSFPGITCEDSLLRLNNLRIKLKQENL